MNRQNGTNGLPSINLNAQSPLALSPLDGPWERASSISNTLDSIVHQNLNTAAPSERSAVLFNKLPPEVILRVLWAVDANGFASLSLINRAFYQTAQKLELYAHHLSRCPSYALSNNVITGPFRKNDLFRLKTKFAAEVRRNLFDAYLRPRETHINLISVNANSSAAFPGGEAFRFEFSPNGRTILALSSSRIYVLDATKDSLEVSRELKTLRRPFAASITDDGSLLAVLSSKYQANIYGLPPDGKVSHLQVVVLDHPPRTITLAHEGTVLAASYEGGIEVFSLAASALSTDRRAVRSEGVDSLNFSGDGSMLVGSSQDLEEPNAVVITAPFYTENDPNVTAREIHSRMWTTQILFPQISSTVSHAALLPGHQEGDTNWLFAYDHMLETYRAVRTDDTRTGVAYFLSPPGPDRFEYPSPNIAPTLTSCGTLAAAGFTDNGLFIYGVPERLDVCPDMGSVIERHDERLQNRRRIPLTSATGHLEPLLAYSPSVSGSSEDIEEDGLAGKVDWRQSLFVKSKCIKCIAGFTSAKWVESSEDQPSEFQGKRLIVTAPGGVNHFAEELGDESMPVDGSRICLLDFEYNPGDTSAKREITIEVGDNEAELLSEQTGNLEIEVAMERRRTVRANRGRPATTRTQLSRAVTAAAASTSGIQDDGRRRGSASQMSSPVEDMTSPQSRASALSRSATAAGFYQSRFPPRPPLGTPSFDTPGQGPYPRQGGGHRGSNDSWETPPPPYGPDGVMLPNNQVNVRAGSPNVHATGGNFINHAPAVNGLRSSVGWQNSPVHAPQMQTPIMSTGGGGAPFRQSTTMDGMMTTDAGPTHQLVQQGPNPRSTRPWQVTENSLDAVAEQQHSRRSQDSPSQVSSFVSPLGTADAAFIQRAQAMNMPGEGMSTPNSLTLRSTMTHPMSPPTPDRQGWIIDDTPISPPMTLREIPSNLNNVSGANLANRLNHPVPSIPEVHTAAAPYAIHGITPPGPQPPIISAQNGFAYQGPHPTLPQHQPAGVDPRMKNYAIPSMLVAGHVSQSASRDFASQHASPHPMRTAGDDRLHAHSREQSGNSSHPSFTHNTQASVSTPNLLQTSRPQQNRFDTASSVDGHFRGYDRERSASLGQDDPALFNRVATDPALLGPKKWKRQKKVKTDGVSESKPKRGLRCVVM